ncbi:NADPH-dependent FMN reductase [Sphaerisporangium fuscum]|uniref:NADPH-dependent FMN reductase n=1 Tax=Sphaerisporangium fuscum TaxID=2835868 RepID=UPI001BDD071C|nr:NAD(P)H-dependent oxidoreductase [Sphaerisporangium fuscum]
MIRIALVVGSTRPGRRGTAAARWALDTAAASPAVAGGRASIDILNVADFDLPLLDEPVPAAFGAYAQSHTRRWSQAVAAFDAFVFVTPEYNHSFPAALKNALDYLFAEWQHKVAGFVGYGTSGGIRAVEQLRQVMGELKVADVPTQVALSMFTDFTFTDPTDPTDPGTCTPAPHHAETLTRMLEEIIAWSAALVPLRAEAQPVTS